MTTTLPALSCFESRRRPASSWLEGAPKVSCSRNSAASLFLRRRGGLVVEPVCGRGEAACAAQLFVGQVLHTDEEAAAAVFAAGPIFDVPVDGAPAAQIEVADAEVGAVGVLEGLGQGVAEVVVDVVEDAGHRGCCSSVCVWRYRVMQAIIVAQAR